MSKFHKKKYNNYDPHHLDLTKLFPNILTLAGLCLGISAIRFALAGKFEMAVSFVVIASFIDAFDGRLARALNATSKFGGELDSLCDFINFGFTPAFVMYLWSFNTIPAFGWSAVLFFTVCTAIRLARFNSDIDAGKPEFEKKPDWAGKFFTGVPSPAGGLLCMAPLILSFVVEQKFPQLKNTFSLAFQPVFIIIWTMLVALLMASRIPTYSFKKVLIKRKFISIFLVIFSFAIILAFIEPWLMVMFTGSLYLITFPFSIIHFLKLKNAK